MNHSQVCENGCEAPAVWRSGNFFFCEPCKEEIIENKGVDAYPWERLSQKEEEFERPVAVNNVPFRRWGRPLKPRKREKPSTRSFREVEPGVIKIPDPTNRRSYREVCRTLDSWDKRRQLIYDRDGGRCRRCGADTPFHDRLLTPLEEGYLPTLVRAGQSMHIDARRMGGGFRDDHPDNLVWGCAECHRLDPTCKFLQREEALA